MVIAQHAAEALAARDRTGGQPDCASGVDERVVEPLMVALGVVMGEVFGHGLAQGVFAEKDHAVEAFVSDGSHEAFDKGVAVRRSQGSLTDATPLFLSVA